jgi:hypothetical protein
LKFEILSFNFSEFLAKCKSSNFFSEFPHYQESWPFFASLAIKWFACLSIDGTSNPSHSSADDMSRHHNTQKASNMKWL